MKDLLIKLFSVYGFKVDIHKGRAMDKKTIVDVVDDMMRNSTERDLEDLNWCIKHDIKNTIDRYCVAYGWTGLESSTFLMIIGSVCNRFVN